MKPMKKKNPFMQESAAANQGQLPQPINNPKGASNPKVAGAVANFVNKRSKTAKPMKKASKMKMGKKC